jgi:uncharacterized membrane protein
LRRANIMAKDNDENSSGGGLKSLVSELPFDRLKDEVSDAAKAMGGKAKENITERLSGVTDKLTDVADGGGVMGKAAKEGSKAVAEGDNPVTGAVKGGLGGAKDKVKEKVKSAFGGGGGGDKATKSTNIIESIDVGVPIDVAYNQWTQFQDFSGFMKKVENVEDNQDEAKLTFKAQVFWSHRTWEAKVIEQVPNERIIWKSKGEKGHVDGAVTFHELAPSLTRILVVLEYYPQGFFEKTGNIWEAQGRRARAELRHFRRHVMTRSILDDDLEGWRGVVHDGKVEKSHDEVVEEEEQEDQDSDQDDYDDEGGSEDAPEDEYDDEEDPEDEPEDEYEDEGEPEEDAPEDEYEDEEEAEPEDDEELEDEGEPEDEYEEEGVDEEAPEEEDDEPEEEDEPAEDEELEDEEDVAEDEEPEEKPRKRSSRKRSKSGRRG